MEIPIKMDDLGVPLFLETPIYLHTPPKKKKSSGWQNCMDLQVTEGVTDKDIWGTAVSAPISPSLVLVKYLDRTRGSPLAKNQR